MKLESRFKLDCNYFTKMLYFCKKAFCLRLNLKCDQSILRRLLGCLTGLSVSAKWTPHGCQTGRWAGCPGLSDRNVSRQNGPPQRRFELRSVAMIMIFSATVSRCKLRLQHQKPLKTKCCSKECACHSWPCCNPRFHFRALRIEHKSSASSH